MFAESMWDELSSWLTPTMLFLVLNFTIATIFLTSGFGSHKQQPPSPSHRQNNKTDSLQQDHPEPMPIQRSASVLQRLKSVNFYQYATFYRSHEPADDVVEAQHSSFGYEAQAMMPVTEEKDIERVVYPSIDEDDDRFENGEDDGRVVYPTIEEEYEEEDRFDHGEEEEEAGEEKSLDEVYSQLQRGSHHSRTKSDMEPASGAVAVKLVKKMKKSASSKSAFRHFKEADILEARRPATVKEAKTAAAEDEEVDSKADDFINKFKQQLKLQRLDSILRYKEMVGRGEGK
ncbi:unnamed protein product [Rhodiola kirilowii]